MKSPKGGRARGTLKGRGVDPAAREEVGALLGADPRRADLLIEYLHRIQDRYGSLSAARLAALAEEMKLAQAEVYEVATFYHHFDVVKEGEAPPPALTVRVCDSIACEMAGAAELLVTHTAAVIAGPDAPNEVMCGLHGQAYLAGTAIAARHEGEYVKVTCSRFAIGNTVG